MIEWLTEILEGIGFRKVPEQLDFLLDPSNIPFAIWETLYAPALAAVFAYVIGLPLGILLVIGEEGGIKPLPKWVMRLLNTLINLLRSVPFLWHHRHHRSSDRGGSALCSQTGGSQPPGDRSGRHRSRPVHGLFHLADRYQGDAAGMLTQPPQRRHQRLHHNSWLRRYGR